MARKLAFVPSALTSVRIAALPLLLFCLLNNADFLGLLAFVFLGATDLVDGYLARRLKATSSFGGFFDATADFAFIIGVFAVFNLQGIYPLWVLMLITFSFIQFVVTSMCYKRVNDPLGKYFGSFLYISILLTFLFPMELVFKTFEISFTGFTAASWCSRIMYFAKIRKKEKELSKSINSLRRLAK